MCNVYCTYELAERIGQTDKQITVNAFAPGLMPATSLARSYSPLSKFVLKYVLAGLTLFHPNINSVSKSGEALAFLVTDPALNNVTGKYFEGKKEIPSSELSYNKANRKDLWERSAALTKLK